MAVSAARYEALRKRLEEQQREGDRAAGGLKQVMQSIREEFNCDSIKAAERLLKSMEAELEHDEKELQETVDRLEAEDEP